jgi:phosphatidylethanolamine/phosphatidyl-N-methylethanolamine N-methyltransferase
VCFDRAADVYDTTRRGARPEAIDALANELSDCSSVLEVGVGTGISLSLYPDTCSVVGVDLTRKMLERARDKKRSMGLKNVDLVEMDAENLTFADDSFDHSVAAFVVTVVPNPEDGKRDETSDQEEQQHRYSESFL